MPKSPRTSKDIAAVKTRILNAALEIIYRDGFTQLSMRKIAKKAGMTAANIYNYFENKDEIYLAIQTRGFAELSRRFGEINEQMEAGIPKIRALIREYIHFGTANPDQYEIMFTRNTPKYADYVGTRLEPAARIEKQTALEVAAIAQQAVADVISRSETVECGAEFRWLQLWTALHGVVSLLNSRVLQEVATDTDRFIESLTTEMTAGFYAHAANDAGDVNHPNRCGGIS